MDGESESESESKSGGFNFNGDIDVPGGSFARLLLSTSPTNIERRSNSSSSSNSTTTTTTTSFHDAFSPPLFSSTTPNMLCFGAQISPSSTTTTTTSTSAASSLGHHVISLLNNNNNNKRRSGSGQEFGMGPENGRKKSKPGTMGTNTVTTATSPASLVVAHAKGKRREKLGERVTALQQLVCPYGKTDTASVLHEATGYIRFLHDQVKVLASPYLQRLPSPSTSSPQYPVTTTEKSEALITYDTTKCLRSRGLCLVPVECIVGVANNNGADFWASSSTLSTS